MWHVQAASAYGPSRQQRVDVIVPDGGSQRPLVVIFAGHWFAGSARRDYKQLAWDLAEHDQPVAIVDIRGHQERGVNDINDLLADAQTGLERAREDAMVLGWDHRHLIFLGCGSGSLVATLLSKRLLESQSRSLRGIILAGLTPALEAWEGIPDSVAERLSSLAPVPSSSAKEVENVVKVPFTTAELFGSTEQESDSSAKSGQELDWPDMLILHGDQDEAVSAAVARNFYRQANDCGIKARYGLLNGVGHDIFRSARESAIS